MASLFRFLTFRGHWGRLGCVLLLPLLHSLHHLHHGAGFYHGFRSRNGKNLDASTPGDCAKSKGESPQQERSSEPNWPRVIACALRSALRALTRRPATEPLKRCPNHCSVQNLELTVRFFPFREVKRYRSHRSGPSLLESPATDRQSLWGPPARLAGVRARNTSLITLWCVGVKRGDRDERFRVPAAPAN